MQTRAGRLWHGGEARFRVVVRRSLCRSRGVYRLLKGVQDVACAVAAGRGGFKCPCGTIPFRAARRAPRHVFHRTLRGRNNSIAFKSATVKAKSFSGRQLDLFWFRCASSSQLRNRVTLSLLSCRRRAQRSACRSDVRFTLRVFFQRFRHDSL